MINKENLFSYIYTYNSIRSLNISNLSLHTFFNFPPTHPISPNTSTSSSFLYSLPKYSKFPNTSTPLPISNPLPNTPKTNSSPKAFTSFKFSTFHLAFTIPLNTSKPHIFLHPSQTLQTFTRIDDHSFFWITSKTTKKSLHNSIFEVPSQIPHFRISLNIHLWFLQPPKYLVLIPS